MDGGGGGGMQLSDQVYRNGDTEFELEGQKSKDKTLPRFNYNMVPVIEGKFT